MACSDFRLILFLSILLPFIYMAAACCLSSDFSFLAAQSATNDSNNMIEHSLLGQSLITEQAHIQLYQRPPVRVRLLSEHQELYQMIAVINQYLEGATLQEPSHLVAVWRELLTHSIADAALRRGGENELTKAINEVVAAVATATTAVAKAVHACMSLLKELSQYVGLSDTRVAQLLLTERHSPSYKQYRDTGASVHDFMHDVEQLVTRDISQPREQNKWSLIRVVGVVAAIAALSVGGFIIIKHRKAEKKGGQQEEQMEQSLGNKDEDVVQRAGGNESSVPTESSTMDMAEKAHWRRRTLSTVTPTSSPGTRRDASLATAPASHPAVPH